MKKMAVLLVVVFILSAGAMTMVAEVQPGFGAGLGGGFRCADGGACLCLACDACEPGARCADCIARCEARVIGARYGDRAACPRLVCDACEPGIRCDDCTAAVCGGGFGHGGSQGGGRQGGMRGGESGGGRFCGGAGRAR